MSRSSLRGWTRTDWNSGMFTGALTVIVGTCIQATAQGTGQLLAGRFILGFGVSFCCVSAPCYVSEMAHPHWRGTLTGFYNCTWYVAVSLLMLFTAHRFQVHWLHHCLLDYRWLLVYRLDLCLSHSYLVSTHHLCHCRWRCLVSTGITQMAHGSRPI